MQILSMRGCLISDLDVCLKLGKRIDFMEIATLKRYCSESDLPYTVDIVDYHNISKAFQEIVDRDGVLFTQVQSE